MPARDGTGPFGTGPVGRGLGPCRGNVQGFGYDQQFGMGMANRWGQRRFGNRPPRWGWGASAADNAADYAADSEIQYLQNQQNWLKDQLDAVTREIEERTKPSV